MHVQNRYQRVQGIAFDDIPPDKYFAAVSLYMGGRVWANFGPKWIYPPKVDKEDKDKVLKPVSAVLPMGSDDSKNHLEVIRKKRSDRGMVNDLEEVSSKIGGKKRKSESGKGKDDRVGGGGSPKRVKTEEQEENEENANGGTTSNGSGSLGKENGTNANEKVECGGKESMSDEIDKQCG